MGKSSIADLLAEIATEMQSGGDEHDTTQTIVNRGLEFVKDADHVSLTITHRKGHETLAATSELALDLDAAQYELDEGPCLDTAEDGEWHRSGDLSDESRWPRWAASAVRRGVRSIMSVRVLMDGSPRGAINFYAEPAGRFAAREKIEEAELFGVHAAHALHRARLVTSLETALSSRHEIGLAQGILMARHGLTPDVAFAALRRVSQHQNLKLRDVAAEVVRSGGLPG